MAISIQKKNKSDMLIESSSKNKEQWLWVLDYLPYGHETSTLKNSYLKKPIIQVIGEDYFTLLEIEPKENNIPLLNSRIDLKNEKIINYIKCRIDYNILSRGAKIELPIILEQIVKMNYKKFIDFYNNAYPISVRMNSLELIPGIGKKLMWDIIEASQNKPFSNFEDLKQRISSYREPEKTIVKRIILELETKQKYNIFIQTNLIKNK